MWWYEDKEYQLMCEKAEEIQKGWKPRFGDWIISPQKTLELITKVREPNESTNMSNYLLSSTFGKGGETTWTSCENLFQFIWLPSQEDLQGMIQLFPRKLLLFQDWAIEKDNFMLFDSFNKLWLAFVMYEIYQKTWNYKKKEWESKK